MKKLISISFLLVMLLIHTSEPASAGIFGKSKCEKVAAQISQEDSVGFNLWLSLDNAWKKKIKSGSNSDNIQIVLATENVWKQYAKTFKIAIDNPNCYSSKQVADMITARSTALTMVSRAKSWKNAKSWSGFWTVTSLEKHFSFKSLFLEK